MASDDLNAPLGQDKKKRPPRLPANMPQILAVVLGLFGLIVVAWGIFVNDPLGGEPVAVVATARPNAHDRVDAAAALEQHYRHDGQTSAAPNAAAATAKIASEPPAAPPGAKTVTIIDGSSGKSRDVVIPGKDNAGAPNAGAPKAPLDPKLLEPTRHGAIPKIGADGSRAFALYAEKREVPDNKKDWPRIAVIVGGLGISASGTADALANLPDTITFALAPYSAELETLAERARAQKHEVLLQVPMEPFDYPDNDPGPQTLLTSLSGDQNIDRLHWLMSRFQGYVGLISYMGGKFTASEASLAPVLREAAKRGLIYVDDGASARSIASQLAGSQNLPFAKTDVVLDAVPTPTEIDHALARLELAARERGSAVGLAGALPATVARIAAWAKTVEGRGFVLVPITMVTVKAKST
ncbi:MAG TPA: divergent polysaccharide deacetylase family protein [Pseudolabrys sp.]|nr:divergent polysaccharide deacetylase family protein [Pseudolabrys sp.]